jgi:serine protease Do
MKQEKPMGAIIAGVFDESPAAEAGLEKGDIILRWGETEITSPLHLILSVLFSKPESKETIEVFRDGEKITLEITIGTRPQNLR